MAERHTYTNRLINERSPYLRQHAHNPVNWYPWCDEALFEAKRRDRPIFLSIGYATCHWCHVMERESFCNLAIANKLNESFICIKVDREERPDLDSLYMDFAQSMISGSTGWPLNLILTPSLRPFFAATYMPPRTTPSITGFLEAMMHIAELWKSSERAIVEAQAQKILELFEKNTHTKGDLLPSEETLQLSMEVLYKLADPIYGSLKGTPKFPIAYLIDLLIHYSQLQKDGRALFLAERTLTMMQRGAIYDHLGGGFSRYCIDEKWLIPHFEKMLCDNALLCYAYFKMWSVTKRTFYKEICCEIADYLLREMRYPPGGFYTAEDAESEGEEGAFYCWGWQEVQHLLPAPDADLFCDYYQIHPDGYFNNKNLLHIEESIEEFASARLIDIDQLKTTLDSAKKALFKARQIREHPFKDTKIVCSWNGLAAKSLAIASLPLERPDFLEAAIKTTLFLIENLWQENSGLHRYYCEGTSDALGNLDDYACLIAALITLFQVEGSVKWLRWAVQLSHELQVHFKAPEGAFYHTRGDDPSLILRKCLMSDGAEPSGNSIHCENLLKLHAITGKETYLVQAEDILKAAKPLLEGYSMAYNYHLLNFCRYLQPNAPTIVISLNQEREYECQLKKMILSNFHPGRVVIWKPLHDSQELEQMIPRIKFQKCIEERTTLYLCRQGRCEKPITDLSEMIEKLA